MMMNSFECFDRHKVFGGALRGRNALPAAGPTMGSGSPERVKEGKESVVYFNIDPKTGKPVKKKK